VSPQPKVLLLTSELFPEFGYPTAGGGVRAQQLFHLFQRGGHETLLGLLETTAQAKDLPEWATRFLYRPDQLDSLIERADPDWVVGESWEPLSHLRIEDRRFFIADCPGPLVLESLLTRDDTLKTSISHKIRTLARMDAILCPNLPMRHYLGAFLTLAGWRPSETDRLIQLPIALPDDLPARKTPAGTDLSIFIGGINWAWHQTSSWLPDLADELYHQKIGHLMLRMGKHPHHDLEESIFEPVDRRLVSHPAVTVHGLAAWDDLIDDLSRAHLAIEWGPRTLEREIASTLRVVTYLWCGVPVILPPHLDLAKEIEAYHAGWVVDRWDDLIELLTRLSRNPEEVIECSRGAQMVSRELHTYSTLAGTFPACLKNLGLREKGKSYQEHMAEVLQSQEDLVQSQNQAIAALKEVIASREETIGARDAALGGLHREMDGLHREMNALHQTISDLHRALHGHEATIAELHQTIAGRDTAIHSLEREIGRLGQELGMAQSEKADLIMHVRADHQDAEAYRAIRRKLIYRIWKRIVG